MANVKEVTKAQYAELIEILSAFEDRLDVPNSNRILATANILNDVANFITPFNSEIGQPIKEQANILLNFRDIEMSDEQYYFNEGADILRKGLEDFISTLEIIE